MRRIKIQKVIESIKSKMWLLLLLLVLLAFRISYRSWVWEGNELPSICYTISGCDWTAWEYGCHYCSLAYYEWDGTEANREVTIPSSIEDVEIFALGAINSKLSPKVRGFIVLLPDEYSERLLSMREPYEGQPDDFHYVLPNSPKDDCNVTLNFTIHVGKAVRYINFSDYYWVFSYWSETGEYEFVYLAKIHVDFIVDDGHDVMFISKD